MMGYKILSGAPNDKMICPEGGFQFRRMKGGIFTLLTAGKGSPPVTLNFWESVDGTF
jgi:hypothetical protein